MRTFLRSLGIILVLSASLVAQSPSVTVADTIRLAVNNQYAVGSMTLSWPTFTTADGTYVAASSQTVRITNGLFSVSVYPTVGATPGDGGASPVYYTVSYQLTTGGIVQERWSIPVSGAALKVTNVLVATPAILQGASGTTLPGTCKIGQLFLASGIQYVCSSPNTWTAQETQAHAAALFLSQPPQAGIPFKVDPSTTRDATASDLTSLLGYTPVDPRNNLSEFASLPAGARSNLGLGTAAVKDTSFFVPATALGAPGGALQLDGSGKAIVSQLPALSAMPGQLNLGQVAISGSVGATKFLNGLNGWTQVDYSQIANAPSVPTDNSQIANGAGYAKSADLSLVATSGRYADLLGLPVFGSAATMSASSFLSAASRNASEGVAGLTAGKLDINQFPVVPITQLSGAGTIISHNASEYIPASTLGQASGPAVLSNLGKVLTSELPLIDYSQLINTPIIPNKTSQLTNDSGYVLAASLASVASSGSYDDLNHKPALNFDPAGAATSADGWPDAGQSSNLSDVQRCRDRENKPRPRHRCLDRGVYAI
jgi:hypothetical protein